MRVEVEEELEELDQHSNSADRHTPGFYVFDNGTCNWLGKIAAYQQRLARRFRL
jgi:hypothetical protein